MSEPTDRHVWETDTDQERHIVIHSPTDYGNIILRDGVYLSEEDAALIVKAVNSHSLLLDALRAILATRDIQYAQQLADEALHAVESVQQVQSGKAI